MSGRPHSERPPRRPPAPRPPGFEHGGVVLINKPREHTSFDVVARVRRKLGLRRVGHAGTLDPMATGVLVVAFDWATRLIEYLTADAKTYAAIARLGVTTTTDDAEGAVVQIRDVPVDWTLRLDELGRSFSGFQRQRPPAFSAIHVDGVRAHKLARAGVDVQIPERDVEIRRLAMSPVDAEHVAIELEASAGTYVRSLARDVGEALGCGAHLTSLQRVASGPFAIAECVDIDEFESLDDPLRGPWARTPWNAIASLPAYDASADEVRELRFGRAIAAPPGLRGVVRVGAGDELVALCEVVGSGQVLRPFRVVPQTPEPGDAPTCAGDGA